MSRHNLFTLWFLWWIEQVNGNKIRYFSVIQLIKREGICWTWYGCYSLARLCPTTNCTLFTPLASLYRTSRRVLHATTYICWLYTVINQPRVVRFTRNKKRYHARMWAAYGPNKCAMGKWTPFKIDCPIFFTLLSVWWSLVPDREETETMCLALPHQVN